MSLYYKYVIDLQNYQMREIPKQIYPYESKFERSLSTSIKSFQKELHWDKMWTVKDARYRLDNKWKFIVFRPKNQIKGWVWLSNVGEIKNLYVSKWQRSLGWGMNLVYAAMNAALETDLSSVFYRCDIWNMTSKYLIEKLLTEIGCKVKLTQVEEDYE